MKEKKMRIEYAISATKAAVEEGIVPGGGVAFINAIDDLMKLLDQKTGDERTGIQIVIKAIEEPIRQIAANAGLEGSIIIDKIRASNKKGYGFDCERRVCRYDKRRYRGPDKVTRSALQNAASVAAMVLTTESLVADIKTACGDRRTIRQYGHINIKGFSSRPVCRRFLVKFGFRAQGASRFVKGKYTKYLCLTISNTKTSQKCLQYLKLTCF